MLIAIALPKISERKLRALCEQLNVNFQQAVEGFRDFVDSTGSGTGAIPSALIQKYWQTAEECTPVQLSLRTVKQNKTRSQAVARIADRTAKNSSGHVI